MQVTFVLVEPQVPENVGASARALKTMGFDQLRLVNSDQQRSDKARWVAHGSREILDQCRSFSSLETALADQELVIGTTAKPRGKHRYLHTPQALGQLIVEKGDNLSRVALVFGREDRGLSNEELAHCDLLTSIPLHTSYPSLNLGQAVMLYAYELGQLKLNPQQPTQRAPEAQWQSLKQRLSALITEVGYGEEEKAHKWALERLAQCDAKDVHFLHSLCQALERRLGIQR